MRLLPLFFFFFVSSCYTAGVNKETPGVPYVRYHGETLERARYSMGDVLLRVEGGRETPEGYPISTITMEVSFGYSLHDSLYFRTAVFEWANGGRDTKYNSWRDSRPAPVVGGIVDVGIMTLRVYEYGLDYIVCVVQGGAAPWR